MLSYRLGCKENGRRKEPSLAKTDKGKIILLSKCAVRGSKKSRLSKSKKLLGY